MCDQDYFEEIDDRLEDVWKKVESQGYDMAWISNGDIENEEGDGCPLQVAHRSRMVPPMGLFGALVDNGFRVIRTTIVYELEDTRKG
jgi:hypothetical protein